MTYPIYFAVAAAVYALLAIAHHSSVGARFGFTLLSVVSLVIVVGLIS